MKKKNFFKILKMVLISLLVLFLLTTIVMAVFGAFFPSISSIIEDFLGLTGDETLLNESLSYLLYSVVLLLFVLLFDDFKNKYIKD